MSTPNTPLQNTPILLVDDDAEILSILADYAARLSTEVHTATLPEDALEIVRNHPIVLAVLDYKMPQMSGLELLEKIRVIRPGVKTVFLSGYADKQTVQKAMHLEVVEFLDKPFDEEGFMQAMRSAIRKASEEKASAGARSVLKMISERQKK